MAVYTKLSEKELKEFFTKYDLGNLLNYKEIKEGIENTNYFIQTEKGKFILTLYEKRVDEKDLPFFISLMKNLFDNNFPSPKPKAVLGSWTLLDSNSILASPNCTSAFPNGEVHFIENKDDPPNRAYLKLQEALMLLGTLPKVGDFCLDFGGSPGGWSWVIQKLGASVLSIDRTSLDPKINELERIQFQKKDAFTITPSSAKTISKKIDWIFWDVICYPEKVFKWVSSWLESSLCRNFIITIKFKQNYNCEIIKCFSEIPGSKLIHLYHNKNELTWMLAKN